MRWQVLLLASAQALFQTASMLVKTVGGLAGAQLAPSPEFATMPIAAMFLGTATVMFPASMWMTRIGRRAGFVTGALLGVAGGASAALGIFSGIFALLCFGTYLVGAYQAFAQFYRFAAGEIADDRFRPRAISLVLGGGIVAAFAGPFLGRGGGHLLQTEYAGSFLLLAMASLIAAGALLALRVPASQAVAGEGGLGRPWRAIVKQRPT
jgi:MFS family permease